MAEWERLLAAPTRVWHFVLALWQQFNQDKVIIRASGLAYVSLLAFVPLVAVLFALFSAFGALDELKLRVQEFFVSNFLPTRQDEIVGYVNEFIENAAAMSFVGFAFLAVTALLLLNSIESNFNELWHVRDRRRPMSKITAYTSVLVLGTLFLGTSLSVSARIKAMLFRGTFLDQSFIERILAWSLPLILTLLGFLLLYMIVPNTRVRWRSAALGALLAGIAWEVAKNVFANSVGQSERYTTLYGSLAVFPIFLVWLYVTWVIVLLGLEIAFTHQHFRVLEKGLRLKHGFEADRVSLALKVYTLIAQRFRAGSSPPSTQELVERFLVPFAEAEKVTNCLIDADLARTSTTSSGDKGLVPATSLDRVRAVDVFAALLESSEDPLESDKPLEQAVADLVGEFRAAGRKAVGETTFYEIVEELAAQGDQETADSASEKVKRPASVPTQ